MSKRRLEDKQGEPPAKRVKPNENPLFAGMGAVFKEYEAGLRRSLNEEGKEISDEFLGEASRHLAAQAKESEKMSRGTIREFHESQKELKVKMRASVNRMGEDVLAKTVKDFEQLLGAIKGEVSLDLFCDIHVLSCQNMTGELLNDPQELMEKLTKKVSELKTVRPCPHHPSFGFCDVM